MWEGAARLCYATAFFCHEYEESLESSKIFWVLRFYGLRKEIWGFKTKHDMLLQCWQVIYVYE